MRVKYCRVEEQIGEALYRQMICERQQSRAAGISHL